MKKLITIFSLSFLFLSLSAQNKLPQLGKDNVKDIVAAMTLEEKANLVGGMGGIDKELRKPQPVVGHTYIGVPGAAAVTQPIPRLGIPMMILADGPAGVRIDPYRNNDSTRTYYATAFPVATLLASSWDRNLVEKLGVSFGNEVLEYGIDFLLAPGMNIKRNPLGGRNFEYYSEDPYLSGHIAASIIRGIQSNGVATSPKHFAANSEETNRLLHSSDATERTLREIYLRGFEIAVKEGKPWTIMTSYNYINGVYTSESRDLLTTILRDEWGFDGFVMTDWYGGTNAIAQMIAGNDLLMPGWAEQTESIINAVNDGTLDVNILNKNVERILKIAMLTPTARQYKHSDMPAFAENAKVARWAAAESMVLLKNKNNTLPLKNSGTIALFGSTSYDNIAGGSGSGGVNKAYNVSLSDGLINAGYSIEQGLASAYTGFIEKEKSVWRKYSALETPPTVPEMKFWHSELNRLAKDCSTAIITIGKNAGEGADRKEEDFKLTPDELSLIKHVSDAFHAVNKKVIVVLNISNEIEVVSWRDYADAILLGWQGGQEGGNALADILSGKVNPSGKLASTFPVAYKDLPSYNNFPGTPKDDPKPTYSLYEEGVYVGYRYFNSFGIKTAYEFGYGQSYTTFAYSNLKLSSSGFTDKLEVYVDIKNTGKVAGKEVVQIYLSAPANKLDKPIAELKGFDKTKELQPGETQTLRFVLNAKDLASYDTDSSAWIAEAGKYSVQIGASSLDIRQRAGFDLPNEIIAEQCHKAMAPKKEIKELKYNRK